MIVRGRDTEHTLDFNRFGAASGLEYQPGDVAEIGRELRAGKPFDVAEFSLSLAMMQAARGMLEVVLLPVFPARAFFHSYLFVRRDSPLRSLDDLVGRRLGLRDFASTGAIWFRGMLAESGIDWRGITWVTGPNARVAPPAGAMVTPAAGDHEQMLRDGAIDVFFSAHVKDDRRPPAERQLRKLLADARGEEAAYFRRSGIFPIVHAVAVSRAALAARPDIARAAYDAYVAAKAEALRRKLGASFMPWANVAWQQAQDLLGADPLPYGLTEGNRRTIAVLGAHLAEQGLAPAAPEIEAMFHPDAAGWPAG